MEGSECQKSSEFEKPESASDTKTRQKAWKRTILALGECNGEIRFFSEHESWTKGKADHEKNWDKVPAETADSVPNLFSHAILPAYQQLGLFRSYYQRRTSYSLRSIRLDSDFGQAWKLRCSRLYTGLLDWTFPEEVYHVSFLMKEPDGTARDARCPPPDIEVIANAFVGTSRCMQMAQEQVRNS